jgi:hypothetical protein
MMLRNRLISFLIGLGVILLAASTSMIAQETPSQEQPKERAALEEKALNLLEQALAEARALRLPENRIRVQFNAGDLLWERSEARARAFFAEAAAGIAQMMQGIEGNDRQYFNLIQTPAQLRQELLTVVARRDPKLAYDFFLSTREPTPPSRGPNLRRPDTESNLEMNLLAQVAATDPALALRNAEETLGKGQFPGSLAKVLSQLQQKDKETAAKLKEKIIKRLSPETLLANQEAGGLALTLLRPGPRPAESPSDRPPANAKLNDSTQVLDEAAFRELMESVVSAALSATPRAAGGPRGPNLARGGPANLRGGANNPRGGPGNAQSRQSNSPSEQESAQAMQDNSRSLLMSLQPLLPQIDKYLPARIAAVRQKLTEVGGGRPDQRLLLGEFSNLIQQGSVDEILQAVPTAPPQVQSRLYQQAAMKALNEGEADRARQIATEHLDERQRNLVLQELERQQTLRAALAGKIEEARHTLARLRSDAERVNWLTQMAAAAAQKQDQKLALQLLEEARTLASRRAENYQHFDSQLKVAHAYAGIDPAHGFEVLEPGIDQLNELIAAAASLSGFEVRIFKEGELPLQGGSQLSSMVARFGQELAALARSDFERAQTAAERFQRSESRILARLAIIRGLLGGQAAAESPAFAGRGLGPGNRFGQRPPDE